MGRPCSLDLCFLETLMEAQAWKHTQVNKPLLVHCGVPVEQLGSHPSLKGGEFPHTGVSPLHHA